MKVRRYIQEGKENSLGKGGEIFRKGRRDIQEGEGDF
jgi:hypothetical protein